MQPLPQSVCPDVHALAPPTPPSPTPPAPPVVELPPVALVPPVFVAIPPVPPLDAPPTLPPLPRVVPDGVFSAVAQLAAAATTHRQAMTKRAILDPIVDLTA